MQGQPRQSEIPLTPPSAIVPPSPLTTPDKSDIALFSPTSLPSSIPSTPTQYIACREVDSCISLDLPDKYWCSRCQIFNNERLAKPNRKRNKKMQCTQVWTPDCPPQQMKRHDLVVGYLLSTLKGRAKVHAPVKTRPLVQKRDIFHDTLPSLPDNTIYNLWQPFPSPPRGAQLILNDFQETGNDWWLSKRARSLFASKDDDDFDALKTVKRYIEKLSRSINEVNGYKSIVEDGDVFDILTSYEVSHIQMKALVLRSAYQIAMDETRLEGAIHFEKCCKEAIESHQTTPFFGVQLVKNSRTVMMWNQSFRDNECFLLGCRKDRANGGRLPALLVDHDDVRTAVVAFLNENIEKVTAEFFDEIFSLSVFPYLSIQHCVSQDEEISTLVPNFEEFLHSNHSQDDKSGGDAFQLATKKYQIRLERDKFNQGVKDMMEAYGLSNFSTSTVLRWMRALGFQYERRKKCYYTDTHEKSEIVEYRRSFCPRYLKREVRCHRWIQLPLQEAQEKFIDTARIDPSFGFQYKNDDGVNMIEYHVDDHDDFHIIMNQKHKYGGELSVRKPPDIRPLIIIGHDECIFKQYLSTLYAWVGSNGERGLVPKDDGQGVMISAFQSREFGFGMQLTQMQLDEANESRRGKHYTDREAALTLHETTSLKPDLTLNSNGGVVWFEYGKSKSGYWSYEHLVLQLEDIVDCIRVVDPRFEIVAYFDHSCGHDRQQEDGLNARDMSKGYGGSQRVMRDTKITEGCLGPFDPWLQPGDVHQLNYNESSHGPFYMSSEERDFRKYDREIGQILKVLSKLELITSLEDVRTTY